MIVKFHGIMYFILSIYFLLLLLLIFLLLMLILLKVPFIMSVFNLNELKTFIPLTAITCFVSSTFLHLTDQ